jgi:hypothetical protein
VGDPLLDVSQEDLLEDMTVTGTGGLVQFCAVAGAMVALAFGETVPLESTSGLKFIQVKGEAVTYKGRKAVKITDDAPQTAGDAGRIALVPKTMFQDGVIELDLVGDVMPGVGPGARGFVGLVFRSAPDASHFECFYLRPTNPRSDDQVRRNHSAQYISVPGFPWQLLREKFPEKYETYVDLQPGEWTKVKIAVDGTHAKLFVHDASQPALIVNDLKQPVAGGVIGLWVGPGTVAHFSNLRFTGK